MNPQLQKEVLLNLTGLEIFFIATTLVSLFINLYQLMVSKREKAALQAPLTNSLVALFNDVKTKSTSVTMHQPTIFPNNNPNKDIESLRWEYFNFSKTVFNYLAGFQEALVGILVTLNPEDKEGAKAFKAADYGITEEEKKLKQEHLKHFMEKTREKIKQ